MRALPGEALATLGCPACAAGPLELAQRETLVLLCAACSKRYPFVGTIPCLVEDPSLWRALWLRRLDEYLAITETRVQNLRREAGLPDLMARTRARVLRVIAAIEHQRARIRALFGSLQEGAAPPPSLGNEHPPDDKLAVLECYENMFRDWSWGASEGERSRVLVERAAAQPLGRLAVYGAGAGRLALDVHRTLRPSATFALDINPLPFLVAAELLRGESVDLYEFPVAPIAEDEVAVLQHLHAAAIADDGFTLVFADALRPPFGAGSLDSVLTSWFIDTARADFRDTAASINRVLRPGGLWINLGPLRFNNALSRCYTVEEVVDIVAASGFEIISNERCAMPYFDSPLSGSRRTDSVICFAARKTAEAVPREVPSTVAHWITDPTLPIPLTPAMTGLRRSSVFAVGVISLVDGSRSIADLAHTLARSWNIAPSLVELQLRAFFARLPPA